MQSATSLQTSRDSTRASGGDVFALAELGGGGEGVIEREVMAGASIAFDDELDGLAGSCVGEGGVVVLVVFAGGAIED